MSSMYTITHRSSMSRKMSFMNAWKTERTVSKPEGHNQILVVPTSGGEGCFPLVPLSDANQVVGVVQVELGVVPRLPQLFEGCGDEW